VVAEVDGSATHPGEDQLVQGTVGVDASESTPLSSHDAVDFGLEPILAAISRDELLHFRVSCKSSGEVDKPGPYLGHIWKTIVKSVSNDWNLCIDITRHSGVSQSAVFLYFTPTFIAEEEIPGMFMEEFANAIRSNPRIEGVCIDTFFWQEQDRTLGTRFRTLVANMLQVMLKSPSLKSVVLINIGGGIPPLNRAPIETLASALRSNLTLNHFRIENYMADTFDTQGLKWFLEPLMIGGEGSYQGLKTLELIYTRINDERAEVLASMMRHNTSLTSISLKGNEIGPQGAACIAEALRSNTTLRKLDIGHNPIGAAGLKALVASLTHNMVNGDLQPNSSLTHLDIGDDIGIEDMELLGTLVRQNTSLLSLDLSNSSLLQVADNVIRLLEALKSNKCLEEVSLTACDGVVGRRVLGTIFDLLEVNHHLKKLNLLNTPLAGDGREEMVKAVLEQKAKRNMWKVLQAMAIARPNSAKMFLCGYPLAGEPMNQFQEPRLLLLLFLGYKTLSNFCALLL
jgi:hypothetical protein